LFKRITNKRQIAATTWGHTLRRAKTKA